MNGVILINKEENYTSRDIVNIVGKTLHMKKVGHTGTLDPMATGVLVVCVGEATKLVETLQCDDKEYEAELILGKETDTLDTTGTIIREEKGEVSLSQIDSVLTSMIGTYMQEVPKYSAVKVQGKKLYEYARNHINVELPKHEVTIYSLERISDLYKKDDYLCFRIRTRVSKGTYIRSLIRDIAEKLGTVGIMSALTRTRQGRFLIDECNTLDDIKNNIYKVFSIEEILKDECMVEVDGDLEKMILNGRVIENRYNQDQVVFKNKLSKVLAIYKRDRNDISKMRLFKMFR